MTEAQTPVQRIRNLRLTDDEREAWLLKRFGEDNLFNRPCFDAIADAQYQKLLAGLVEILPEWLAEQRSTGLSDDPYIPNAVYEDFELLLKQAMEEPTTERTGPQC